MSIGSGRPVCGDKTAGSGKDPLAAATGWEVKRANIKRKAGEQNLGIADLNAIGVPNRVVVSRL